WTNLPRSYCAITIESPSSGVRHGRVLSVIFTFVSSFGRRDYHLQPVHKWYGLFQVWAIPSTSKCGHGSTQTGASLSRPTRFVSAPLLPSALGLSSPTPHRTGVNCLPFLFFFLLSCFVFGSF